MNNPFLMTIALAGAVLLGTTPAAFAVETAVPISAQLQQPAVTVKARPLREETSAYKVDMEIPIITGMLDERYQAVLNDTIMRQAMQDRKAFIAEANQLAKDAETHGYPQRQVELTYRYEVKSPGTPRFSMVVTKFQATGASGQTQLYFYNVLNEQQAKKITLQDLFGPNYQELLTAKVRAGIKEREAAGTPFFEEQFKGVTAAQGFYVTDSQAVLVFQKYEIAPGYVGQPEFPVPLPPQQTHVSLAAHEVYQDASGQTMIPLRQVAEVLGFAVTWHPESSAIEVRRGAQWTQVTLGRDSYFYAKMAPVSLGAAPMLKSDTTYVPLGFANVMLKEQVIVQK